MADKTLRITVLNKEHSTTGGVAKLTINAGMPLAPAEVIFMAAPQGDITSITGITIGDAQIKEDGSWNGTWSHLPAAAKDGTITVTVPAASAAVIKLQGS